MVNNITHIQKNNGSLEPLDFDKLNKWIKWLDDENWNSVVLDTMNRIYRTTEIKTGNNDEKYITSKQLQLELIQTYLNQNTHKGSIKASRLYLPILAKDVNNDFYDKKTNNNTHRHIKDLHNEYVQRGLMSKEFVNSFTDDEYNFINHQLDYTRIADYLNQFTYYQVRQLVNKYALDDQELPQYIYIRIAMAVEQFNHSSNRLEHIKNLFRLFISNQINIPTPYYTNSGTIRANYNSCCVYTTKDDVKSLATGDHIAYTMTYSSAGIGANIQTRTINDKVKGGAFTHLGKLPYYRACVSATRANTQNSRGGAVTITYYCYDPEYESIQVLKNPLTPNAKQIREADYSMAYNEFFARKVAKNEQIALFSMKQAPEIYENIAIPTDEFEKLYNKAVSENRHHSFVNARDVALGALKQSIATGRHYYINLTETNKHTPFNDYVYQSNLCLHGDTKVTIKVGDSVKVISMKALNDLFHSEQVDIDVQTLKDGEIVYRKVTNSAIMGKTRELLEVSQIHSKNKVICTHDHEFVTQRGKVKAIDLILDDGFTYKEIMLDEPIPVYDITVDDTHTFLANDILVSNCQEIAIPTKGYNDIMELYSAVYNENQGEVGLCSLAGIVVNNVQSDDDYYKACYYALRCIHHAIHNSEYVFPQVAITAKSRNSAGVGIVGLAHYLATRGLKYDTLEGRNAIHKVAERHYYMLAKASLELSKEFDIAKFMDRTKWVNGYTPLDTYNKNVDELHTEPYHYDWESLSKAIKDNGGIHNSVLVAHMPAESSSISSGTTNGVYPIRRKHNIKNSGSDSIPYVVPDDDLDYQIAYDIDVKDMKKVYAILQKFTDQAISADEFLNMKGGRKIGSSELLQNWFTDIKYGNKTRYYVNQEINTTSIDDSLSSSSQSSDCCSL